jgi:hypothetical protein
MVADPREKATGRVAGKLYHTHFVLIVISHTFRLFQRLSLPWIPAFAGMTFFATPLVKAVIPANAGIQGR